MNYFWLSYSLQINGPRPPAIPASSLKDFMTIKADGANVQELTVFNHTGTHLDTAAHVIENGVSITAFTPVDLIFKDVALISLSLPEDTIVTKNHLIPYESVLKNCDMAVFRFGVCPFRTTDPQRFCLHSPGFGVDAANYLKAFVHLRCIGIDAPSFATIAHLEETMVSHNIFLEGNANKRIIIEEMCLEEEQKNIDEIRINPWLVEGMNSGPCSIVGIIY
jgi:arylformamidase